MTTETGMTLKQWGRTRYLEVCRWLRELRSNPALFNENKKAFIMLSLEAQQLKQHVPRSWYKFANN